MQINNSLQGKYHEAIALYDLALEHEPESLTASQGRAFCKTLLLAQIPLEDHAVLVKSIVEDLESATDLSRVLLGDLLGT